MHTNQGSPSSYSGDKKWNNPQGATNRPANNTASARQITIETAPKEAARSKGWNVEEEIDKKSTRNLLMAWKQKDKANTFVLGSR